MQSLNIIITGGSGFIGQHLKAVFQSQGHNVFCPKRSELNLQTEPSPNLFKGIDAFVHLAYDFDQQTLATSYAINVEGSLRLFAIARAAGVKKIIHISSMSAFEGCRSVYGQTKLQIEKQSPDIFHIRPGLVYGEGSQGIYGAIKKVVSKLPVVPVIGTGRQVQFMVHVEDLCKVIALNLGENEIPFDSPLSAAYPKPILFREMILQTARKLGKRIWLFPIPYTLVKIGLKTLQTLGIKTNFRADSLVGLQYSNHNPVFNDKLSATGIFRSFS